MAADSSILNRLRFEAIVTTRTPLLTSGHRNTDENQQAGLRALYLLVAQDKYPNECKALQSLPEQTPEQFRMFDLIDWATWGDHIEAVIEGGYLLEEISQADHPEFAQIIHTALQPLNLQGTAWAYPLLARILYIAHTMEWPLLKATSEEAATAGFRLSFFGTEPQAPVWQMLESRKSIEARQKKYLIDMVKFWKQRGIGPQPPMPEIQRNLQWLAQRCVGSKSPEKIANEAGEAGCSKQYVQTVLRELAESLSLRLPKLRAGRRKK